MGIVVRVETARPTICTAFSNAVCGQLTHIAFLRN